MSRDAWRDIVRKAPRSWSRTTMGSLFTRRDERGRTELRLLSVTSEHGVVPRDEVGRRDTSAKDKSRYLTVKPNDVVYNTMRMWQGVSGVSRFEGITSPAYTVCTPDTSLIDPGFAGYLLRFPPLVAEFHSKSQGIVDDTLSLKYPAFAKVESILPPLREQQEIAEILSSVDETIRVTQAVVDQMKRSQALALEHVLQKGMGHLEHVQTICGSIPKSWEVRRLGEVIHSAEGGVSVNSENRPTQAGEVGILKTSCVTKGCFEPQEHKTILPGERQRAKTTPVADSIIFSRMNTPLLVGASGYVEASHPNLFLPDRLWLIRTREHCLWLSFLLSSPKMRAAISASATGTSGSMKNISKQKLFEIPIPVPRREEQAQIAEFGRSGAQAIRNAQESFDRLLGLKAALLSDLLTGRKRVNNTVALAAE